MKGELLRLPPRRAGGRPIDGLEHDGRIKVACVSGLHGHLPDLGGLDFDVLLVGGDVVPKSCRLRDHFDQAKFLNGDFARWVDEIKRPVVLVAGNHDGVFEKAPHLVRRDNPWCYLEDSAALLECRGRKLRVYGSPWQPRFHDWAFNLDEPDLKKKWAAVPDGTDVLLLHGPPYGYGDRSPYSNERTGSPSLTERIDALQPRLVVFGHIHSGYGRYTLGDTVLVNASLCDERYLPTNPVQVVEI